MPQLLAKAVITLVAGSFPPTTQPQNSPNLAKLYDAEKGIRQLEQQLQQMDSQLNRIPTKPFLEVPVPLPQSIEKPAIINIKPYGPSFQFNGLTVYVEPIAMASPRPRP